MSAVDRSGPAMPSQAFAPSAAEVPLLRERLQQLGTDVPIVAAPVLRGNDAAHGLALLWNWTAPSIDSLRCFAESCQDLDLALLVGIARWVPLDSLLDALAAVGLTPSAAARIDVGSHRGVELRLTREEVPATQSAAALLELVTWSALWHRGRQQHLRLAVEGLTPHDLRDHPHACDLRAIWGSSPGALRLASPEIVLVGAPQAERPPDPAVLEALAVWGAREVECSEARTGDPLQRPTLTSEALLLAASCVRSRVPPPHPDATTDVLLRLAAGSTVDVRPEDRLQLAPEVVAAAEGLQELPADTALGMRAKAQLRWSVLRQHSAVALVSSLEARTGRVLAARPRVSLCLDGLAGEGTATLDAVVRQLAGQRRRPDEVVLLTADDGVAARGLRTRLHRALDIEVVVDSCGAARPPTGDLIVVAPLDAQLAIDALADLELAYRLWSPTVSVIPVEFLVDEAGQLYRSGIRSPEGLGVPATAGVVAVAGREFRATWRWEDLVLSSREAFLADAVQRGAMVYTMPSIRAVFRSTPATLEEACPLDAEAAPLLVADRAVP